MAGKRHGKVEGGQQQEQGLLSAMVVGFDEKARTQGSRIEAIQHAKCIEKLSYVRLFWTK